MATLTLTDEQAKRLELVRSKHGYATSQEVLEAGIALLEAEDDYLRQALAEAEEDWEPGQGQIFGDGKSLRAHFAAIADARRAARGK
jgi:hypothetical protein